VCSSDLYPNWAEWTAKANNLRVDVVSLAFILDPRDAFRKFVAADGSICGLPCPADAAWVKQVIARLKRLAELAGAVVFDTEFYRVLGFPRYPGDGVCFCDHCKTHYAAHRTPFDVVSAAWANLPAKSILAATNLDFPSPFVRAITYRLSRYGDVLALTERTYDGSPLDPTFSAAVADYKLYPGRKIIPVVGLSPQYMVSVKFNSIMYSLREHKQRAWVYGLHNIPQGQRKLYQI
jgi:hypothetical protein